MEEIAINIIKDGGMVAVLFVLWFVSSRIKIYLEDTLKIADISGLDAFDGT